MAPARPVGRDFFPLDEELALLSGSMSPHSRDHLIRLAVWMPFARAAEMLAALPGVQVSETTIRRHTYRAGTTYQAVQTAQADGREEPEPTEPVGALVLSTDGAMVPLVHGQWAEVKTLVIGEVHAGQDLEAVQSSNLSYFSRMSDAATFAEQATVETMRRGVSRAERVCAVMDGAEWIDGFVDFQCHGAQRILDFPHAAEYVSEMGRLAGLVEPERASPWLATQLHTLKHEGPAPVLEDLCQLCQHAPADEEMRKKLAYLQKREERMQYPLYQQQGWPIGSGIVESGNKVVMQARLKGPGMHWAPSPVNPMLALRTAACNDRWDEAQHQTHTYQREQRHQHQQQQVIQHARQQCCQVFEKRIAQRSQQPPLPYPSLPIPPAPHTPKPSTAYSWRQPFLRRPPSAKK